MSVDALLDEIVERKVLEVLRRRGLDAIAPKYTSSALPPDLRAGSEAQRRRTFNRICRSGRVAGAVKVGQTWECTASAWRSARTKVRSAAPVLRVVPTMSDDEAIATRALASMGGRRTR